MKTRLIAVCALLLAIGTPASAHRLDEYLQATLISVERNRVHAQMRLTPGVKVFPGVFANIDTDHNGILSAIERKAYAERMLRDLSLILDGKPLSLRLASWKFATTAEMKEGRGDIELELQAEAPQANGARRLVFENHHQNRIAVYLVNGLVPHDPDIHVTEQRRNTQQSWYELDYVQTGVPAVTHAAGVGRSSAPIWLCTATLLLFAPLVWLWRHTGNGKETIKSDGIGPRKTAS